MVVVMVGALEERGRGQKKRRVQKFSEERKRSDPTNPHQPDPKQSQPAQADASSTNDESSGHQPAAARQEPPQRCGLRKAEVSAALAEGMPTSLRDLFSLAANPRIKVQRMLSDAVHRCNFQRFYKDRRRSNGRHKLRNATLLYVTMRY